MAFTWLRTCTLPIGKNTKAVFADWVPSSSSARACLMNLTPTTPATLFLQRSSRRRPSQCTFMTAWQFSSEEPIRRNGHRESERNDALCSYGFVKDISPKKILDKPSE